VFPKVWPSSSNPENIINAWNGGAYDTKRDRLIVWGGGHADYAGNEVYVFDMNTLKWTRLNEPSSFGGDPNNTSNIRVHGDGAPVSRHTYIALQYIPQIDRFYVGSAGALWRVAHGDPGTYLFDFDTLRWTSKAETPVGGIGSASAVGPDGRVWQMEQYGRWLAVFDSGANTWTKVASYSWIGFERTAEVDHSRNIYALVGMGETLVCDLNNTGAGIKKIYPTGPTNIQGAGCPGLAYVPRRGQIFGWAGGAAVYALDLGSNTWTKFDTTGSVSPGQAQSNGTYGRFRYIPSKDMFVVVNGPRSNVFVYRVP
jgi:hypothetical protein